MNAIQAISQIWNLGGAMTDETIVELLAIVDDSQSRGEALPAHTRRTLRKIAAAGRIRKIAESSKIVAAVIAAAT